MKKAWLLALGFMLLLCGCARPIDTTFDLSKVGTPGQAVPLAQPEAYLEAPTSASGTPELPNVPKITTRTEQTESLYYGEDDITPLFFSSIQRTKLDYPTMSRVSVLLNRELDFQFSEKKNIAEKNLLAMAEESYRASLENPDEETFYEFSYYANDSVHRLDENVLSLATYYSSNLGGTHPENLQIALNYDLQTADRLSLGSVLSETGKESLCGMVQDRLQTLLQDSTLFPGYEDVVASKFGKDALDTQWDNWYFAENSLVVFLNPHEISPYVAGVVYIEFCAEDFLTLVRAEYLPDFDTVGSSSIFAGPADAVPAEESCSDTVVLGSGNTAFSIGCNGSVYDVSICYNLWAGEESTAREVLYRTTYLTAGEIIRVELGSRDEIANLCIRFTSGDGVYRTVRFGQEVLDQIQIY